MSTFRSTKENNRFLGFYAESKERLEKKIEAYNAAFSAEPHPLLTPFFKDFSDLNEGGKLLRGVLVTLGYYLAGREKGEDAEIDRSAADPLAVAFEIFQTAVLIHDDIIDHAELRRGKQTVHRRYAHRIAQRGIDDPAGDTPASAALCIGDAGLYAANAMIARSYMGDPKAGELIAYFDDVVIDTIRGELLDVILPCEIRDPAKSEEETAALLAASVGEIYHLKTARYSVIGPLHLGMLLGGASEALMNAVDRYADEAGVAFQIKDDILGIFADEQDLGKDVGSDIAEAKLTILYQYVREHDPEAYRALMEDYGTSPVTKEMLRRVQHVFMASGALEYAKHEMEGCFVRAEEAIKDILLAEEDKELLLGLLEYFRGRNK